MALRAKSSTPVSVFLNVPYDKDFEKLFLAYIAGLTSLGLSPKPAIAIPNDKARLSKIIELIDQSPYSIHDLSRVQVYAPSALPRFNMPLELGLALYRAHKYPGKHSVFIFEEQAFRVQQSTSDLNAFDSQIHGGKESKIMGELRSIFVRQSEDSSVPEMLKVLRALRKALPAIKRNAGTRSLFGGAAIFKEIALTAGILNSEIRKMRGLS